MPNEFTEVERPFYTQLRDHLGYQFIEGDEFDPSVTERPSFQKVLLESRLRAALIRINPWMTEAQINEAVARLERLQGLKLIEANQEAHTLLIEGTSVNMPNGERNQTVRYIDFEQPEGNDFLVINQFRVDSSKGESIKLDLVIFVNGVPLVVIEAKSPVIKEPVHNAIEQLLRYSNQRGSHEPEGAEQVFHYNLLCVATCFDFAKIGTIGAKHKHYQEWKDPYPLTLEALAAQLGRQPSAQQMLISSVFAKDRLLDILYNFTLFTEVSGRRVKIVPRYQQFRAVGKSIEALHRPHGATPPGLPDERSGIVWHTQGSGKSFTMTYLVRKMRTLAALREYKIVVITDRRNLQKQLVETARLSGDALQIARSVGDLKRKLEQPGSGLVFGMIQKFRGEQHENTEAAKIPANLNSSEKILLLVDEAHRSHARTFHATLMAALPNCAKMGFTGTPIFQKDKKRTEDIFGKFIDTYTIAQSQIDGSTLPIFYEGRTANGVVAGGESINKLFDNLFKEHSEEEKELIRRKYGRYEDVAEAPKLIAEKAKDMLRHFVAHILPGGFKAQVVASSRLAAVRYQAAFENARNELVTALETQGDLLDGLDTEDDALDAETVLLLRALPHLETIKRLEFAAIISGAHNDEPLFHPWTDPSKQDTQITRFKRPLADDPLAFIVVNAMLLTGFDAPVEQVLYLDRSIQDQDLLQAIARVNRPEEGKNYGLVVDYFGVAHHLTKALELYAAADIERALIDWRDQLPRLQEAHRKVIEVFAQAKVPLSETETCALFLADERTRAEFTVAMRAFNAALDAVLPRPEGLAYLGDLKQLGFIQRRAANLYRDQTVDLAGAEKKIRALIDRYIEVEQVSLKVAPLEVLSPDFSQYVHSLPSKRSQAAEMEHAARHYVTTHAPEDPVFYGKLKERLERILHDHLEHWDAQIQALTKFIEDVRNGVQQSLMGLDARSEAPFFRLLLERTNAPDETRKTALAAVTKDLVSRLRQQVKIVDFWRKPDSQNRLKSELMMFLLEHQVTAADQLEGMADELLRLARVLHSRLT